MQDANLQLSAHDMKDSSTDTALSFPWTSPRSSQSAQKARSNWAAIGSERVKCLTVT